MKRPILLLFVIPVLFAFLPPTGFLEQQKKYERVRTAVKEKEKTIETLLKENGLGTGDFHMLLMAYKDSDELELYVKKKGEGMYKKIKTYAICARSGDLGPKRKQGDNQVPEGFYHIDRFNPVSSFYLSLGVNYPNASDKKKSKHPKLGGDIFIHGSCVTIGCLPLTDPVIKELYLYAVFAKNNGQGNIPVYLFPFKMSGENFTAYKEKYKTNKALTDFWTNLKTGYDKFEKEKKELKFSVNVEGDYTF